MIDLLLEMLRTPEDQADAYVWGAALLGHFAIGLIATALVGTLTNPFTAAAIVSIAYAAAWEGSQMAFFGSTLSDSAIDALAVLCGALVAAGAWRNKGLVVACSMLVLSAVGVAGVHSRQKNGMGKQ